MSHDPKKPRSGAVRPPQFEPVHRDAPPGPPVSEPNPPVDVGQVGQTTSSPRPAIELPDGMVLISSEELLRIRLMMAFPSSSGGGAIFTGIRQGTYQIGGGSITVNGKGQVINIVTGNGGGDIDVENVGAPPGTGLVFQSIVGDTVLLRSLVGTNGATVSTVGENVIIDGGGGTSPVQSADFEDDMTLDLPVGSLATDGQVVVDMSVLNTVTGDQEGIQWVFGVSPTSAAASVLEVPADGVTLLPINFVGLSVGPNVVARLQGLGTGDLNEVRYRVTNIPRL